MKYLFALYDKDDNFINCGFSLKEVGVTYQNSWFKQHRNKKIKLYRIPLKPQKDIFEKEDEIFIEEFKFNCYTVEELAKIYHKSKRTIYRFLKKGVKYEQ